MLSIPALEALNSELIDTLWNVNRLSLLLHGIQVYELIDTLWNVNKGTKVHNYGYYNGINRYIMECKFFFM